MEAAARGNGLELLVVVEPKSDEEEIKKSIKLLEVKDLYLRLQLQRLKLIKKRSI